MNRVFLFAVTLAAGAMAGRLQAASPEIAALAEKIDTSLAKELELGSTVEASDDATFLRRAFLDLIGQTPTPDDVLAFSLDPDETKRARIIDQLLEDEAFGENWARYWRDTIMYRRVEPRAALAINALEEYLRDQLNSNAGWDRIATDFITATGDIRENGAAALIMAQAGKPEDVVAEVSRIFLGIQIQCAQCHDHPTDRWQREQFHELAAFFPRVAIRARRDGEKRSFEVSVNDQARRRRRNNNNNNRNIGTPEHFMPDLDDPSSQGTKIQPVFFLTGEDLPFGTRDADRRGTLAEWITAPENPWFAKAFVNRVWAELAGEGLCEPVDDMGPDREGIAPATLELLATAFADSNYDVKWLFRTIMATRTYQQDSRTRRDFDDPPLEANCPQRLRADQLYDALAGALGIADRRTPRGGGAYGRGGPRAAFNLAFGFDPSEPRGEVKSSVQQALLMMNSPLVNQPINARRNGRLSAILKSHTDDRDAISELYLLTLSRAPSSDEVQKCLRYIRQVDNRGEAFEDLQWALVNSTEFLHRR